jgi:type VI secretion system protein ImpG
MTFSKLALSSLRFFLKGQPQHTLAMHDLLFNNVMGVTISAGGPNATHVMLPRDCIRPVGFDVDEGLLPYSARSFPGYRMLSEYFAFPEKFQFFDLTGFSPGNLASIGNKLEVNIHLNKSTADLEHNVSAEMFRLGCTPMVNLYTQRAEPIRLTQTDTEYHVVPDARRPLANEIYSINKVVATSPKGDVVEYLPFFSFKHAATDRQTHQTFWYATRRPGQPRDRRRDEGTEMFISFVDLDFNPAEAASWTVDLETVCLNRDMPHKLPFGGGQPRLQLTEGGPISRITCLTPPTPTLRPAHRHEAMWRIISHLSLNHLSIVDGGSPEALREILKLYDYSSSAGTQAKIASILEVKSKRVVGRAGGVAAGGFCRGVEVDILFDEDRFADNGLFLFASVLERFLGLYCSINSFSKLVARSKQRQGVIRQWPPRAAEKILL